MPHNAADRVLPAAAWRQFVLFFDAAFTTPRGVRSAQAAALEFVTERALPTDLISVVTFNVVDGVRVVVPLTADHYQVEAAIRELGLTEATRKVDRAGFLTEMIVGDMASIDDTPSTAPGEAALYQALSDVVAMVKRDEEAQYRGYATLYAEQLGELARVLEVVRGRKQLILFSTGIEDSAITGEDLDSLARASDFIQQGRSYIIDSDARFGGPELRAAITDAIKALRLADTVVHVVDTEGLGGGRQSGLAGGSGQYSFVNRESGRDSLIVWADGTGGTVTWERNDIGTALGELEQSLRSYYVVALRRDSDDRVDPELRVEAEVPGVGVENATRRIRLTPDYSEMSEAQRQAQLAEFISKGIAEGDLQFSLGVAAYDGRRSIARVPVVVEVPWREVEAIAEMTPHGELELDLAAYAIAGDGRMTDFSNRTVRLDFSRLQRAPSAGLPLRFYDLLWAPPGEYELRVLVRESSTGRLRVESQTVTVPNFETEELVISTPMGLDLTHPGLLLRLFDEDSPPPHKTDGPIAYPFALDEEQLTPAVLRKAAAGTDIDIFVRVRNLEAHPLTGATQASFDLSLTGADWRTYPLPRVQLLGRSQGREETIGVVLRGAIPSEVPAGEYRLAITVIDHIAGTETTRFGLLYVAAEEQRSIPRQ